MLSWYILLCRQQDAAKFQWESISNEDVTNVQIVKLFWPRTSFLPSTEYLKLIFNSYYHGTLNIMVLITPATII